MEATKLKKQSPAVIKARMKHFDELKHLRINGLKEYYRAQVESDEIIESFFTSAHYLKTLEHDIEKSRVYLVQDPLNDSIKGFFQFQYQEIAGDNGICKLPSFYVDQETSYSSYFVDQLAAMEELIQSAGCYRIKGVASEKEFMILERMNYQISAPKYRHTIAGCSMTFVPFMKILYHLKP